MLHRAIIMMLGLFLAWVPAAHADDRGRFVEIDSVPTDRITPPHVTVWLPPGYDTSKRRYGVVYMHDGQNLFFRSRSNFDKVWAADQAALGLIASGKVAPFIIVGIDQPGPSRSRQYLPQALYDRVTPATRKGLDVFLKGPVYSDAYLAFIVSDLKPMIDRRFRTRPDRRHTAIAGSSMGGLISLYAITRHPKTFGVAGAVSTHVVLGSPIWGDAQAEDIKAAWDAYVRDDLGRPRGRRIWFDHGTETLDAFYAPYQSRIDAALVNAGWRKDRDFVSIVFPGTAHEENAWADRLPQIFAWMLADWK
jgi:predicted alpha/beta superfamily hydrolase